MPSKIDVLRHLTREELLDIAMSSSVEASSSSDLVDGKSGKTVVHEMLKRYSVDRLKSLCRAVGVQDGGEDKSRLIERLIWTGREATNGDGQTSGPYPTSKKRGRPAVAGSGVNIVGVSERDEFRIDFPNVVRFTVSTEAVRCDVEKVPVTKLEALDGTCDVVRTARGWVVAAGENANIDGTRVSREQFYKEHPIGSSVYWIANYVTAILSGNTVPLDAPPTSTIRLRDPYVVIQDVRAIVDEYVHHRTKKQTSSARLEDIGLACNRDAIIARLVPAIELADGAGQPVLMPAISDKVPSFSTRDVRFATEKPAYETAKSQVSHVVVDGKWEESAAYHLEESPNVTAYVKNDQSHVGISYEWKDETKTYLPDFLIKITGATWIIEMERPPSEDDDARWNATAKWMRAVNNLGRFGRWKHVICRNAEVLRQLVAAPAPPFGNDGTEFVNGRARRPHKEMEWWELERSSSVRRRRRKSDAGFHISGVINAWLPPPSSSKNADDNTEESDRHEWVIPCRCNQPWCDGIRTVSASDGKTGVMFVGAHFDDPNQFWQRIISEAIEDAKRESINPTLFTV